EGIARDLEQDEQHEDENADRCHRFVLAMAVRMVFISRPLRRADADERDDVRRGVGQRMETVGEDRNRSRPVAESDLSERDEKVEDENASENADNELVASAQNTCAVGIGHHRSCTLPMMYFFGTNPQWRLSELLFR